MFKEGKETISKELNKRMRIMSQQIENNNKEIEIIKTHQIPLENKRNILIFKKMTSAFWKTLVK